MIKLTFNKKGAAVPKISELHKEEWLREEKGDEGAAGLLAYREELPANGAWAPVTQEFKFEGDYDQFAGRLLRTGEDRKRKKKENGPRQELRGSGPPRGLRTSCLSFGTLIPLEQVRHAEE